MAAVILFIVVYDIHSLLIWCGITIRWLCNPFFIHLPGGGLQLEISLVLLLYVG